MKRLIALLLALAMVCVLFTACSDADQSSEPTESMSESDAEPTRPNDGLFRVGDSFPILDNTVRCTFLSSGEYTSYPAYASPEAGKRIIFVELLLENITQGNGVYAVLPSNSFACYADGAAAELYEGADSSYGGQLLPGYVAKACFFYQVPENADQIRIEYQQPADTDAPVLLYEGTKHADTVPAPAFPSAGAVAMNQSVTVDDAELALTDIQPVEDEDMDVPDGCRLTAFTFTVRNLASSESTFYATRFAVYADGVAIMGSDYAFLTLNPGESGQITFTSPIPDHAMVELAYFDPFNDYAVFRAQ